jgi:hypothetical protein
MGGIYYREYAKSSMFSICFFDIINKENPQKAEQSISAGTGVNIILTLEIPSGIF